MKRLVAALAVMSAFLLLSGCGADTATDVPPAPNTPTTAAQAATAPASPTLAALTSTLCAPDTPGTPPAYLKNVVLAKSTQGENFTPVDVTEEFEPSQEQFHAVAALEDAPSNTTLRAAWYLVQAAGYAPDTKIDENELSIEASGTRNVVFTLSPAQDAWPPGDYCVEIYVEGTLALSKRFKVVGGSAPSNATTAVVKQVVLAEDAEPQTFQPIRPTSTFKQDAPFIHAAVEIVQAPDTTKFVARWYPPNQEPLNFDLTTGGSRWLDFRLTPAPDGFPTGEYKVEIYVNDALADTKTFTVQ